MEHRQLMRLLHLQHPQQTCCRNSACPPVELVKVANANVQSSILGRSDLPRNAMKDAGFAAGMATGMRDYEQAVAPTKRM